VCAEVSTPAVPLWEPVHERHERLLSELRKAVGDAAFDAAHTRGATLDIDDVRELARVLSDTPTVIVGGHTAAPGSVTD
jgi:hypothetical protein